MSNVLISFDESNRMDVFTSTQATSQHVSSIYKVNNNNNCMKSNYYNFNKKANIIKQSISDNNNKNNNNIGSDDNYDDNTSPIDIIYNGNDNISTNAIISSSAPPLPSSKTVTKTNVNFGTATSCTKSTPLVNEVTSNEGLSSEDRSQSPSEYTDADESISAPTEFLAEFLSAVMVRNYKKAIKYCKLILQYEPNNATAREFYPLILNKLRGVNANEKYNSNSIAKSSVKLALKINSGKATTFNKKQLIAAFGTCTQPVVITVANFADNINIDNQLVGSTNYSTIINDTPKNDSAENDNYGIFSNLTDATITPSPTCYIDNIIGFDEEDNFNDDNDNHNVADEPDDPDADENVNGYDDFNIDSDDVAGNCYDDDISGVIEDDDDTSSSSGNDLPVDEHQVNATEMMELESFLNQGNTSNVTSINSCSGGKTNSRSDNTSYSYSSLLLEEDDDIGILNLNSIKLNTDMENINGNSRNSNFV